MSTQTLSQAAGMNDVTLVTPFRNGLHLISLMYESYVMHHGKPAEWICCYDESWDGATEYAQQHATKLLPNPERLQAGRSMDRACLAVETPYTLLVETDVEFLGPVTGPMVDLMTSNALCVSNIMPNPGECDVWNYHLYSQERIAHHCSLFDTKKLQHLLKFFSFESYCNFIKQEYYDGGAMILRGARAMGWDIVDPGELNNNVCHYGGVTSIFTPDIDPNARTVFEARHEVVQKRLEQLCSGQQTHDWLRRIPMNWLA